MINMTYIFTEVTPSRNTYGRGGAGNVCRSSDLSAASAAQTTKKPRQLPSTRFHSGIGGAGNVHQAAELRPALLRSLETPGDQNPNVGYVGRGGAGNVYRRKASDASSVSSVGSTASSVGEKAKLWASRLSGSFGRK